MSKIPVTESEDGDGFTIHAQNMKIRKNAKLKSA